MRTATFVLVILLAAGSALAGDYDGEPFSLRFSAALPRFSRYPDAAGMCGTGAGSPWASSVNPASGGVNPPTGEDGLGLSIQYAYVPFEEGTRFNVGSFSLGFDFGEWGAWQPSVLVVDSNEDSTADGLDFEWEAWTTEIQVGFDLGDDNFAGVNVSYLASEMTFSLDGTDVTESDSTTWTARVGYLRRVDDRFFAGLAVDWSAAPSRTKTYDFMGLGIPTQRDSDTTWYGLVRPGIYFFATDDLTVYFDYQFGYFTDDSGILRTHRFFVGLDETVIEGVYLRAGSIVDTRGKVSVSVGLGIAPSEDVLIDAAYQRGMFPELDPEFGRGDVMSVGVSFMF